MDKRTLRAQLRALRDAADPAVLPVPLAFRARLSPAPTVATYVPIASEADPAPFVRAAIEAGCRLALPHIVDRATPLRFVAWNADAALHPGPFDLRQPAPDAAEVEPDIILTPLVGFDRTGNRIGQGAGHYDRAFAAHPAAWRVGVAISVQEVPVIVADAWDIPLHAIATEQEWIEP